CAFFLRVHVARRAVLELPALAVAVVEVALRACAFFRIVRYAGAAADALLVDAAALAVAVTTGALASRHAQRSAAACRTCVVARRTARAGDSGGACNRDTQSFRAGCSTDGARRRDRTRSA